MDQAIQAAAPAFGFLRGGFAVASWLLQINTLHSSQAIASPVCLSQFNHHRSSLLSSDEDDTILAVKLTPISSCVVVLVLSTFECKDSCNFQKIRMSSVVASFCYTAMYIIQSLFLYCKMNKCIALKFFFLVHLRGAKLISILNISNFCHTYEKKCSIPVFYCRFLKLSSGIKVYLRILK